MLNRTKSDQIGVNRTKSEKLKSLGISGKLLDWITNFLHLSDLNGVFNVVGPTKGKTAQFELPQKPMKLDKTD